MIRKGMRVCWASPYTNPAPHGVVIAEPGSQHPDTRVLVDHVENFRHIETFRRLGDLRVMAQGSLMHNTKGEP
jgi:hypothetical protein